ncbi:hypothetical protein Vafri_15299 [Volvox africanus]|uniref:Uncharacterized protein n=1 Tax=Volvox africanus TaxID=51714 RepID=A0A8J4F5K6_9CHLO|nr:hypothetical protein Vafri_15299 [Volvox africanus]
MVSSFRSMLLLSSILLCRFLRGQSSVAKVPTVSIHQSQVTGVKDLSWNNGANTLQAQLQTLGFAVQVAADGEPTNTGTTGAPDAYIIPVQHDQVLYFSADYMDGMSSFVASGGLVILLDAGIGDGASIRDFISVALEYKGKWHRCKYACIAGQLRRSVRPTLSRSAPFFLPEVGRTTNPWPRELEGARATRLSTWCHHEDSDAVTVPLYTATGDEGTLLVAQAFGKVGVPGAIVWLGYSWKAGPQEQWDALLNKIITDFAAGVRSPAFTSGLPDTASLQKPLAMPEATIDIDNVQDTIFHRALSSLGAYPTPEAPPSPVPPSPEPPSPSPPSPQPPSPEPPSPSRPPRPPPKKSPRPPPKKDKEEAKPSPLPAKPSRPPPKDKAKGDKPGDDRRRSLLGTGTYPPPLLPANPPTSPSPAPPPQLPEPPSPRPPSPQPPSPEPPSPSRPPRPPPKKSPRPPPKKDKEEAKPSPLPAKPSRPPPKDKAKGDKPGDDRRRSLLGTGTYPPPLLPANPPTSPSPAPPPQLPEPPSPSPPSPQPPSPEPPSPSRPPRPPPKKSPRPPPKKDKEEAKPSPLPAKPSRPPPKDKAKGDKPGDDRRRSLLGTGTYPPPLLPANPPTSPSPAPPPQLPEPPSPSPPSPQPPSPEPPSPSRPPRPPPKKSPRPPPKKDKEEAKPSPLPAKPSRPPPKDKAKGDKPGDDRRRSLLGTGTYPPPLLPANPPTSPSPAPPPQLPEPPSPSPPSPQPPSPEPPSPSRPPRPPPKKSPRPPPKKDKASG